MLSYLRTKIFFLSSEIFFLFYFHLSVLILFFVFRLMFMFYFYDELLTTNLFLYLKALFVGIRLDLIVSSYLSLPILFTIYLPYIGWNSNIYKKLFSIYLGIILLILTFILMLSTLLIGPEAKGATRWISLGPLTIQPSEFSKPFFTSIPILTNGVI